MAKVYLDSGDDFIVASRNTVVFGAAGDNDRVTVLADVTGVVVDQNIERVNLGGSSSDYRYQQVGNNLKVFSADGAFLLMTIPLQDDANGTQMSFSDGIVSAKFDTSGGAGLKLNFGGAVVESGTPTKLVPTTISSPDGTTVSSSGKTFTLTTGVNSGSDFKGGSGNDTFNAALSSSAATLNNLDSLDGGAGTDTINIELPAGSVTPAGLSGIEVYNISTTGDATLDLANASGVTSITSSGSSGTLTINSIPSATTALAVSNTVKNHTFNFTSAAVAGTSDVLAVALNTVGSSAILAIGSGIETLALTVTGANDVDTAYAGKLTVAGAGSLTLTAASDAALGMSSINASAATGAIKLATSGAATITGGAGNDTISGGASAANSLTGGAGADSLVGGSGNDTISGSDGADTITAGAGVDNVSGGGGDDVFVFGADLTTADTIDGGDGTDTLSITSAAAAYTTPTTRVITSIERLTISDALVTTVTVANIASDINTVTLAGTAAGGTGITGPAGTFTVNLGAALGADLSVTDTGTAITDTLNLVNTSATNVAASKNITSTGYETVNITGTGTGAATQAFGTITVTPDTGGSGSLNFIGSNSITTGVLTAKTISAVGLTGTTAALTMVGNPSTATSVTGGPNADTLLGQASAATTIDGGGGNDTISGGSAADSIFGGAGGDSIVGGGGADTLSGGDGADSILGGTGNDYIEGGLGADTINASSGTDYVSGGDGNDYIIAGANLTSADTVLGGDGTDTVTMTNTSVSTLRGLSFSDANTFLANFTSIETVIVSDAFDQGTTFDAGYFGSALTTLRLDAAFSGNETISGITTGDRVELRAQPNTVADILTVQMTGSSTSSSDVLTLALARDTTGTDYGVFALANVETLNIVNSEATAASAVLANTIGLTLSQVTGGAAQSVVITGTESLTIDTAIAAGTIDASGMTSTAAGFTMSNSVGADGANSTATTARTITGSGGVDVLRGSAGNDVISGGAGADSLFGGAGDDTINGGTGADTVMGGLGADGIDLGAGDNGDFVFYNATSFETGNVSTEALVNGGQIVAGVSLSTVAMDKVINFGTGDTIGIGGNSSGATLVAGSMGDALSGALLLIRGTYSSTAQTFVFSASGVDSLLAFDADWSLQSMSSGGAYKGIVLVGYVDTSTPDVFSTTPATSGLLGQGG